MKECEAYIAFREAAQEFVERVERGEVRSKYTYSKFKELLETYPSCEGE